MRPGIALLELRNGAGAPGEGLEMVIDDFKTLHTRHERRLSRAVRERRRRNIA